MRQATLTAIVEFINEYFDLELTDDQKQDLECDIEHRRGLQSRAACVVDVSVTTVQDAYNITDFEITKLAETKNPYWETVRDFWWQKKEDDVSSLSPRQAAWLSKIEEDLDLNWRPKWMEEEGAEDFYA